MKKLNFLKYGFAALMMAFAMTLCYSCSSDDEEDTNQEVNPPSNAEGQINGHAFVDLGLSVMWATCNVGASSPEKYGDYYAWGETETNSKYGWSTYKWCYSDSENTLTKYCTDHNYGKKVDNKVVLDPNDDVAHVKWGGCWRMPTDAEMTELGKSCTWTWTTQNGTNGYKVTSKKNGNSIFLPAAGYRYDSSLNSAGSHGYYWSSTEYADDRDNAYRVYLDSRSIRPGSIANRGYGFSVRLITECQ